MKNVLLAATLLLTASVAVGQNPYQLRNFQPDIHDMTTETSTNSAWKQINGVCSSLSVPAGAMWCLGAGNNAVYKFNAVTHGWDAQTAMGAGVFQLAAAGSSVVFALMHNGYCDAGEYGVSQWNGSAWNPPFNACGVKLAAGTDGTTVLLALINSVGQLWTSTDLGHDWTRQVPTNTWAYVSFGVHGLGCAVDTSQTVWSIAAEQIQSSLPAIPSVSGTITGCVWADVPSVVLAWTSTGAVYSMPLENFGTWSHVTGLAVRRISGVNRFRLFAEASNGNVNHWNVGAPSISGTYGGQWNTGLGCPDPSHPCVTSTTHTVHHNMLFTSGHGIGGGMKQATDVFTHDIEVANLVYNPSCDPYFGQQADPECIAEIHADAFCNESRADVQNTDLNWVIDDTIDLMAYTANQGSSGPMNVVTGPGRGYILGQVYNWIRDACRVSDPTPVCPVSTSVPIVINNQVDWFGQYSYGAALSEWTSLQNSSVNGADSPYAVHGFYLAQKLSDGTLVNVQCFGGWLRDDDFYWGNFDDAPHCK